MAAAAALKQLYAKPLTFLPTCCIIPTASLLALPRLQSACKKKVETTNDGKKGVSILQEKYFCYVTPHHLSFLCNSSSVM